MYKNFSSIVGFLVILLTVNTAFAAGPTDYVKAKTKAVTDVLSKKDSKKRQKALDKVVQQTIDFRELAKRALGKHWEARTAEEQQEFLDLLQTLLQANYEDKLTGKQLGADYKIEYTAEKTKGTKALVKALVVVKEEKKPVNYRLYKSEKGWAVYDLVIDDISLEETYRDGYVEIIEAEGWASLISRMKEKAKALRAK